MPRRIIRVSNVLLSKLLREAGDLPEDLEVLSVFQTPEAWSSEEFEFSVQSASWESLPEGSAMPVIRRLDTFGGY